MLILAMASIVLAFSFSSCAKEQRYINAKGPHLETYEINKTVKPLKINYKVKTVKD